MEQSTPTARESLHSSKSVEWYTPPLYIEAVRRVLGSIDLDPASNEYANQIIGAKTFYTQADDGLTKPWPGRWFCNPPYGRAAGGKSSQALWTAYGVAQYRAGISEAGIMLINAATGNKWFDPLWDFDLCFTPRIKFYNRAGRPNQPTHGNVFAYLGPDGDLFAEVFSRIGVVIPAGAAVKYA